MTMLLLAAFNSTFAQEPTTVKTNECSKVHGGVLLFAPDSIRIVYPDNVRLDKLIEELKATNKKCKVIFRAVGNENSEDYDLSSKRLAAISKYMQTNGIKRSRFFLQSEPGGGSIGRLLFNGAGKGEETIQEE